MQASLMSVSGLCALHSLCDALGFLAMVMISAKKNV